MKLDQSHAPYVEAVIKYVQENRVPFHMPGHKQGVGIDPSLKELWGENIFKYDLTEVDGLDYLNAANGVILQAEELAADAFGAKKTFFLINGSTTGNIAAILACVKENEKILVCRNAHQSTSSGVVLSGALPVYASPTLHPSGYYPVTGVDAIRSLLAKHPDIKAVHVTSPTHVGLLSNLAEIVQISHAVHIPVIVDEAHGSHFAFHEKLPSPALKLGADFVTQSTHKTLGAFTQTSMFHIGEHCPVPVEYIDQILRIIQSTSPSTIFVMGLDAARRQMALDGKNLLDKTIALAETARAEINQIEGFFCYGRDEVGKNDVADIDLTKLLIDVRHSGHTGYELEKLLGRKYKIEIEMSDANNILCFVTIGDTPQSLDKLVTSLKDISREARTQGLSAGMASQSLEMPAIPELALTPRQAFFSQKEAVAFAGSAGQVSAEYIVPFPPDIPIVVPGERITAEIIDYVDQLQKNNTLIIGPSDTSLQTILVIR